MNRDTRPPSEDTIQHLLASAFSAPIQIVNPSNEPIVADTVSHTTRLGQDALPNGGENNTAIGFQAGFTSTTGSNNIFLGFYAIPSIPTVSNEIVLGNASITALRCQQTSIAGLSDARDKTNIVELDGATSLAFVNQLKPVEFNWDQRSWYENGVSDGSKMGSLDMGLVAQQIVECDNRPSYQIVKTDNPDRYEVAPARLIPLLISAIQELSRKLQ